MTAIRIEIRQQLRFFSLFNFNKKFDFEDVTRTYLDIENDIKLKFDTVLNVSPINKTKIVL